MNDKLDDIFHRQQSFQLALDKDLGKLLKKDKNSYTEEELQKITKETVLQLFSEIHEVLSEINWKHHIKEFPIQQDKIREEIIDVFHFVVNLALIWGMNAEDVYKEFVKKNNKNFERFAK